MKNSKVKKMNANAAGPFLDDAPEKFAPASRQKKAGALATERSIPDGLLPPPRHETSERDGLPSFDNQQRCAIASDSKKAGSGHLSADSLLVRAAPLSNNTGGVGHPQIDTHQPSADAPADKLTAGHIRVDIPTNVAAVKNNGEEGGHFGIDSLSLIASLSPQNAEGSGQRYSDAHPVDAAPSPTLLANGSGPPLRDTPDAFAGAGDDGKGEAGQVNRDTQKRPARSSSILALRELFRQWRYAVGAVNKINSLTGAMIRSFLGDGELRKTADMDKEALAEMEKQRKAINETASTIRKAIEAGEPVPEECRATELQRSAITYCTSLILAGMKSREPYEIQRDNFERDMKKHVANLPVYAWMESVKGFAAVSLAKIVGICGDLSDYSNPGKVWKRMGLAPFQGKAASTWRGRSTEKLTGEQWTELGYSPFRRSQAYVIGTSLLKAGGEYKRVYDERRTYEAVKHPEFAKGTDKKTGKQKVSMQCHLRAMRYMEKRLLRNLWREWRRLDRLPFGDQFAPEGPNISCSPYNPRPSGASA